ncbi:MAG: shikimate dehydrogenase [Alphaproteobacteria bacterium]|nr:shikimate dehydrogenase [Alphaproteobacteria bacterium]
MTPTGLRAGVMGWPVEHSLSPRLHGWWLKRYSIEGSYVPLAVPPEGLGKALRDLPAQGFRGVNLTVPHKEAALVHIDHIDTVVKRIGAVNTVIVRADGTLEGRNTDTYGFAENLRTAGYKPDGRAAVIIGAGGAARAAVAALQDMGVKEIRIINRSAARAQKLAADFGNGIKIHGWGDAQALEGTGLLVNATSLGLKGQPMLDIALDALPKDTLVTDMVYAPLVTDLLLRAGARGNPVLDGLGMLLHQALPSFAAFFGHDPEVTEELRRFVLIKT